VPRIVTLVLVDGRGSVIAALPPFGVPSPWWPEVAEVVDQARLAYGVDVVVLRLLDAVADPSDPFGMGGTVTYLASLDGAADPPAMTHWRGALDDHPLRPFAPDGWRRGPRPCRAATRSGRLV
jgi:hypothetical protein